MSQYDLGTARGRIDIDSTGAVRGVTEAKVAQQGFVGGLSAMEKPLKTTGTALLGIGAAAAAGMGLAVKAASDFEKELSGFKAVTGSTHDDMERIRAKAMQLGRDTAFSAKEAAQGMTELGKAGMTTDQILGGAADAALDLAAAGELELGPAAEIMASTMAQFSLKASDASRVANVMAGAANASTASVEEMAEAMKYAGPVASAMGLSLEDTATALAVFHQNGIKGSMAGTAMRAILTNIQPTTERATDAMKELGLITADGANTFFDAQGKIKPMEQVIGQLTTAFSTLNPAQQAAAAEAIFGDRAMAALISTVRGGPELFNQFGEAIGKTSAADVAKTRMDNLAGSLKILRGSIETALIQSGSPAQESLRGWADEATRVVNAFSNLTPEMQRFIVNAVGVTAVGGVVGGTFLHIAAKIPRAVEGIQAVHKGFTLLSKSKAVAPVLSGLSSGASALGSSLAALAMNPITWVVIAIVALVAALIYAYKHSETFRNFVDGIARWLVATVGPAFHAVVDGIVAAFHWLMEQGTRAWEGIRTAIATVQWFIDRAGIIITRIMYDVLHIFEDVWNGIAGIIRTVTGVIATVVEAVFNVLSTYFSGVWRSWEVIVDAVWNYIRNTITNVLTIIRNIIGFFINIFTGDWSGAWQSIKNIAGAVWDQIWNIIDTAIQLIIGILGAAIHLIIGLFRILWDDIVLIVRLLWRGLEQLWRDIKEGAIIAWRATVQFIKDSFNAMVDFFVSLPGRIVSWWNNTWASIKQGAIDAWNGIKQAVSDGFNAIVDWFTTLPARIAFWWEKTWLETKYKALALWEEIKAAVSQGIAATVQFMSELPGKILHFLEELPARAFQLGKDILQGLINGFGELIGAVGDKAKEVATHAMDSLKKIIIPGSPSKATFELGISFGQGLAGGIAAMQREVEGAALALSVRPVAAVGSGLGAGLPGGGSGAYGSGRSFEATVVNHNYAADRQQIMDATGRALRVAATEMALQ